VEDHQVEAEAVEEAEEDDLPADEDGVLVGVMVGVMVDAVEDAAGVAVAVDAVAVVVGVMVDVAEEWPVERRWWLSRTGTRGFSWRGGGRMLL